MISQVLVKALSLKYKYLENSCSAKMQCNTFILLICTLMPYPCSQFCADVKFDIRFDNRFDVKLGDSFHVSHTIKKLVKDPDEISVLGLMEFDWKETSFDLEFLAVNSQF